MAFPVLYTKRNVLTSPMFSFFQILFPNDFQESRPFDLKIEILNIVSPVLYIVRPLEYRQSRNMWYTCNKSDEFAEFQNRLYNFYAENTPVPLNYDDIDRGFTGVYIINHKYERCCVIKKT